MQPPTSDKEVGVIGREAVRQQGILRKLNEIIVPEINYREAVVSDVITFLSDESRRLDPEKIGVNIVLGGGIAAPSGPAVPPAAPPPLPSVPPKLARLLVPEMPAKLKAAKSPSPCATFR